MRYRRSPVIDDDIQAPEGFYCLLHRFLTPFLVRNVQRQSAHSFTVFLQEIAKAFGLSRRCDEGITGCEHRFRDTAAQAACAAGHEPVFCHWKTLLYSIRNESGSIQDEYTPISRPFGLATSKRSFLSKPMLFSYESERALSMVEAQLLEKAATSGID